MRDQPAPDAAESALWRKAETHRTLSAVMAYRNVYPRGYYKAEADALLAEIWQPADAPESPAEPQAAPVSSVETAWQEARDLNTAEAYTAFVQQYPEAQQAAEARDRIEAVRIAEAENEAFIRAKQQDTRAAYNHYLTNYPEGLFSKDARYRMRQLREQAEQEDEDHRWQTVRPADRIADYKQYLSDYPNGRYAGKARFRLGQLRAPAKPAEPDKSGQTPATFKPADYLQYLIALVLIGLAGWLSALLGMLGAVFGLTALLIRYVMRQPASDRKK